MQNPQYLLLAEWYLNTFNQPDSIPELEKQKKIKYEI